MPNYITIHAKMARIINSFGVNRPNKVFLSKFRGQTPKFERGVVFYLWNLS